MEEICYWWGGGWFWKFKDLQSLTLISLLPACDVKCDLPDFCSNYYACLLSYIPPNFCIPLQNPKPQISLSSTSCLGMVFYHSIKKVTIKMIRDEEMNILQETDVMQMWLLSYFQLGVLSKNAKVGLPPESIFWQCSWTIKKYRNSPGFL